MYFLTWITNRLSDIAGYFYDVYLETLGWVYPFWLVANFFYQLHVLFTNLAWDFYNFNTWATDVASKVASILNFNQITAYFSTWINYATTAWNWVINSWSNVSNIIGNWWSSVQYTVQVWIETAKQFVQTQIDNISTILNNLKASVESLLAQIPSINELLYWFTDWWGKVLVNLTTWWNEKLLDVRDLINTAFKNYEPFWEGWQDCKNAVVEFFTDPWQWLYDRLEDFFERFW
uniref:Uncharacterized protein n=1 Tax=viral metagenome TaxID=1070528 RepID=A0A6M3LXB9_9ZZZZ